MVQKFREHRLITNLTPSHFDRSDLQVICIDPQVKLPPLTKPDRPVFVGYLIAFSLRLDPGAIDQQIQCASSGAIRNGDVQTFLAARQSAEFRHRLIASSKLKRAGTQPCRLQQRQDEKCLRRQARLHSSVGGRGRATPPSAGLRQPYRLRIKPNQHRATLLQGGARRVLVRSAVGRRCGFAHALRVTLWIHTRNASRFVKQSQFINELKVKLWYGLRPCCLDDLEGQPAPSTVWIFRQSGVPQTGIHLHRTHSESRFEPAFQSAG